MSDLSNTKSMVTYFEVRDVNNSYNETEGKLKYYEEVSGPYTLAGHTYRVTLYNRQAAHVSGRLTFTYTLSGASSIQYSPY